MRLIRALAASLSLVSGTACGAGDLVLPEDQSPSAVVIVDGDGQAGTVGAELAEPLVVRVLDSLDRPVAGVQVAFELGSRADGGDTSPDTATTSADGKASARWVLGGASGRQEVSAQIVGVDLAVGFSADAARSSSRRLERSSGDEQRAAPGAALAEPLVVRLLDQSGEGVEGQAVAWVVAVGGGAADPSTSDTDAEGFARASWTLGPGEGANTLNAVVSGAGVVSFTATAVADDEEGPSPERSTVAASPANIVAGAGVSTIAVTVRDGSGAAFSGATVTLAATGSGNVLTQPSGPTGSDGVATGTLQGFTPGTRIVSAVVNGTVAVAETAEVIVSLAPLPTRLEFLVAPSDTEEDEEISPAVEVAIVDAQGRIVALSGVEIEMELLREGGKTSRELDGERTASTSDGVAVFYLAVDHDDDGYRLRASAPGRPELGSVVSSPFDVED